MMIQEFSALTGFYPTEALYKEIEAAYYDFPGDKAAFCKAYKENENGLAETITCRANENAIQESLVNALTFKGMETACEEMRKALEREQEWKPFEDSHNTSQADYDRLARDCTTRELSDGEAINLIASEFGFDRSKIVIVHELKVYEINRHNQLRVVGKTPRKALFNAWDWNYIVFNVKSNVMMGWEMHNGALNPYWA